MNRKTNKNTWNKISDNENMLLIKKYKKSKENGEILYSRWEKGKKIEKNMKQPKKETIEREWKIKSKKNTKNTIIC